MFVNNFYKVKPSQLRAVTLLVSKKLHTASAKVIQCRAAICFEPNKPLKVECIEVAPPKAHEVRIKMAATGVCHSDAHIADGLIEGAKFPVILGHEGAGFVESIGECVTKFKVGDHVIPMYTPRCGECRLCVTGKTNLCEKTAPMGCESVLPDNTSRFTWNGKEVRHFMGCSTFSEYTVVADYSLAKINSKAPSDKVCLIGCGVCTGYGAAVNTAKVQPGSSCAVWGLGGIGLAAAMGCRNSGATRIIGIDVNPAKFKLGAKFGCTEFVNPLDLKIPIQEHIHAITCGGVDYSFEAVGTVKTMRDALESTTDGWGLSVVLGVAPSNKEISCLPHELIVGKKWMGCLFGGYQIDQVSKVVDDYMNKKILVDEFITHTMSLDKINDAFDLMKKGKSLRSIIIY